MQCLLLLKGSWEADSDQLLGAWAKPGWSTVMLPWAGEPPAQQISWAVGDTPWDVLFQDVSSSGSLDGDFLKFILHLNCGW